MTDTTLALLEQLASRICHDLISPVGAINNGIELAEEMGADGMDDAIELIGHSAKQAAAKLKTMRMAYGAGANDPSIKPDDVANTFRELVALESRLEFEWPTGANWFPFVGKIGLAKAMMCVLLLGKECLPRGGIVAVSVEDESFMVTCTGTDAGLKPDMEQALAGHIDIETMEPKLIHPYLTHMNLKNYGQTLTFEKGADEIVFKLVSSA